MKRRYATIAMLSFAGGIGIRSFFDVHYAVLALALLVSVACFAVYFMRKQKTSEKLFAAGLIVIFLLFGAARFGIAELGQKRLPDNLLSRTGTWTGIVVDEPDIRDNHSRLTVRLTEADGETLSSGERVKILVTADLYPRYRYGDRLTLVGTPKVPERFSVESTGRVLDYPSYLKKDGIGYTLSYARIERVAEGEGNPAREILVSGKERFLLNLKRIIPEPDASLLGGILLGAKHSLGSELLAMFASLGIIHIVVLSGYNISLVADIVRRLTGALPYSAGLFLSGLCIIIFVIFAGGGSAAIRAGLMALAVLLARYSGRFYDAATALLVVSSGMLLLNPYMLMFDPSFELSFFATLGLISFSPVFERWLRPVPARFQVREILATTLATQAAVLPLLIYMTGAFSLIALPADLLVLVVMPYLMVFGLAASILGLVSTFLALPFAYGAYALLEYILLVSKALYALPSFAFEFPQIPGALIIIVLLGVLYSGLKNVVSMRGRAHSVI